MRNSGISYLDAVRFASMVNNQAKAVAEMA